MPLYGSGLNPEMTRALYAAKSGCDDEVLRRGIELQHDISRRLGDVDAAFAITCQESVPFIDCERVCAEGERFATRSYY